MCSGDRNPSLTPVMTAPLEQLRDTRRKDSSTALKPMTATEGLDSLNSLNTGQQLSTVCPAPHTGSLALWSGMKIPRAPQRGEPHSLPLFIYLRPPPSPPSLTVTEISPRPLCLSPPKLRHLTPPDDSVEAHKSPLLVHQCLLRSDQTSAQSRG